VTVTGGVLVLLGGPMLPKSGGVALVGLLVTVLTVGFDDYSASPDERRFRHESAGNFAVSESFPTSMHSAKFIVLRKKLN